MYFTYGETELSYLRQKDKRLGEVIDRVGPVRRAVDTDLFSAVVHHIVGQQISTKAQATIWQRMQDALGRVNAENVLAAGVPRLQALGMTSARRNTSQTSPKRSTPAPLIWTPWRTCPTRRPSAP